MIPPSRAVLWSQPEESGQRVVVHWFDDPSERYALSCDSRDRRVCFASWEDAAHQARAWLPDRGQWSVALIPADTRWTGFCNGWVPVASREAAIEYLLKDPARGELGNATK